MDLMLSNICAALSNQPINLPFRVLLLIPTSKIPTALASSSSSSTSSSAKKKKHSDFANQQITVTRLAEVGLVMEDVPRDGNCAFHCYSRLIGLGDAATLRQVICDHISNQSDWFEVYLPERFNGSTIQYLQYMRRPSKYGYSKAFIHSFIHQFTHFHFFRSFIHWSCLIC